MTCHVPDASVVIVSFNTRDILRTCLASLKRATGDLDIEVIVVDNASHDGSADMVAAEFPRVSLLRSAVNLGFAGGNNAAFGQARGRHVILLNPDTLLDRDTLDRAIAHMDKDPSVGMAGGRLLNRDGSDEPAARQFPSVFNDFLALSGLAARFPGSRLFGRFDRTWAPVAQPADVDWVPGAFAIIRGEVLAQVGHFDERFFLYYEEVDLCRRIRAAGWRIRYWPDIVVHHWGGESSKTLTDHAISSSGSQLVLWRMRSALLYYRKQHGRLTAWAAAQLEIGWHALRRAKVALTGGNPDKSAESTQVSSLMRRAWAETAGGRVSPSRPW
jgi:GT2 family glycosyltransferase